MRYERLIIKLDIGFAGLELDNTNPEIEIGYWFLPSHWNKGYATELARALIQYAFPNLSITTLIASAPPDNTASQNVLLKSDLHLPKQTRPPLRNLQNPLNFIKLTSSELHLENFYPGRSF